MQSHRQTIEYPFLKAAICKHIHFKKFVRVYNFTSSATNENGSEGSSLSSIKLTNACEPVNHMEATQFIQSTLALQLNL